MRKYILLLIMFVLVFGASVKAAPNTSGGARLQQDIYDRWGVSITDEKINQITNNIDSWSSDYYYVVIDESNSTYVTPEYLTIIGGNNFSLGTLGVNGWTSISYASPWKSIIYRVSNGQLSVNSNGNINLNFNNKANLNVGYWSQYSDATDYSNVYYDPFIPTPIINSYYFTDTGVGADYFPCVCNVQDFQGNITYLQVIVRYYTPEYITVYNDGSFKVSSLKHSYNRELVGLRDRVTDSTINLTNLIETDWNTYVTGNNPAELIGQDANFENSSAFAYLSNQYNSVRNIQTLYGNAFEIWARYFEIKDNKIYVGSWFDWYSRNTNDFSIALPSWFVVNDPVVGVQNTVNNTGTDFIGLNPLGNNTGQDITIEINGSLVPNYPDYPTAVTYNHDNILLQTIETANRLPALFGQFGDFLKEAFVFIPVEVWNIIAFGFLCSIFVMIVKVL